MDGLHSGRESTFNACRNLRIAVFSPTSKSTNVSAGQSFCCNSSRETTFPAFAASSTNTRNGCSCSLIRTLFLRSSLALRQFERSKAKDASALCGGLGGHLHLV